MNRDRKIASAVVSFVVSLMIFFVNDLWAFKLPVGKSALVSLFLFALFYCLLGIVLSSADDGELESKTFTIRVDENGNIVNTEELNQHISESVLKNGSENTAIPDTDVKEIGINLIDKSDSKVFGQCMFDLDRVYIDGDDVIVKDASGETVLIMPGFTSVISEYGDEIMSEIQKVGESNECD